MGQKGSSRPAQSGLRRGLPWLAFKLPPSLYRNNCLLACLPTCPPARLPACPPLTLPVCPPVLPAHAGYARMAPSSGPSYDIAMLVLSTPSVAPTVALTSGSAGLTAGEIVWAAGFGITETGEASSVPR